MPDSPDQPSPLAAFLARFDLRPTSGQRAVTDMVNAGRSQPFRVERRDAGRQSYHYPPCCTTCRRTISTTDVGDDTCNPSSHPEAWANAS